MGIGYIIVKNDNFVTKTERNISNSFLLRQIQTAVKPEENGAVNSSTEKYKAVHGSTRLYGKKKG